MKKNITYITIFLLAVTVSPAIASADLGLDANLGITASTTNLKSYLMEKRDELLQDRKDFRASTSAMRASTTLERKALRASTTAEIKAMRDNFIKDAEARRAQFKAQLASTTAETKLKRQQFLTILKDGLAKIKDEFKKKKVESVANTLPEINIQVTTRAAANVDKIDAVNVAMQSRVDKIAAASTTVNLANVRALIVASQSAVTAARTAISVQAAKVYNITITSDATAKASVQAARNQLKADIDVMNAKVKAAKDAAKKAADALKAIQGISVTVSATTTASTTQ